eukprot:Pgem_evm1s15749
MVRFFLLTALISVNLFAVSNSKCTPDYGDTKVYECKHQTDIPYALVDDNWCQSNCLAQGKPNGHVSCFYKERANTKKQHCKCLPKDEGGNEGGSGVAVPNALRLNLTAAEITHLTDVYINETLAIIDEIAAIPRDECNFETVYAKANFNDGDLDPLVSSLMFLSNVHPDANARKASVDSEKKISEFSSSLLNKQNYYRAFTWAAENLDYSKLSAEDQRLVNKTLAGNERSGVFYDAEKKEKLQTLSTRQGVLSADFSTNIAADDTAVEFTKEELVGVSDEVLATFQKNGDKYIVDIKPPSYNPVMSKCTNEATRRALWTARYERVPQNDPMLKEMTGLRLEEANIKGYPTFAEYGLAVKMAKNQQNVLTFLEDLQVKLRPLADAEMESLSAEKPGSEFHPWDFHFYTTKVKEEKYSIDANEIKNYFSLDTVLTGMLNIYETLLSVKFVEKPNDSTVWHPDVKIFELWEADKSSFLGHMYLDLMVRSDKYEHAAVWPLQTGGVYSDGSRRHPAVAMVTNFPPPTDTKPSLMSHGEMETFFHELGHAMHGLCSKTKWSTFHGTSVERDFVEAPSQMLENWVWEKDILQNLSSHYLTKEKLSDEIIDKMLAAKQYNVAISSITQIAYATYDMKLTILETAAQTSAVDIKGLWESSFLNVTGMAGSASATHPSTFGHLMGGYAAGYYGYMWSKVYSQDMYTIFQENGVMNEKTGMSYRTNILKPGSSLDASQLLLNFLGREPNNEAFLKSIGL